MQKLKGLIGYLMPYEIVVDINWIGVTERIQQPSSRIPLFYAQLAEVFDV